MAKRQRRHPEYYYEICDGVIAKMGPEFNEADYREQFPKVARLYNVIPFSDGYLAHRRIIMGLVKAKLRERSRNVPKDQLQLV